MIKERVVAYEHNGAVLEGFLACDDATDKPRPGILISHAWAGRGEFECQKARDLAELGYAGFALDLYGKGVLGSGPEENTRLMTPFLQDRALLQARMQRSLEIMQAQPEVDSKKAAAIGFCFGGLCVLDLARIDSNIKGVISFHGLFNPPANFKARKIKAKVLVLHGNDDPMVPVEMVTALEQELTRAGADWQIHVYGNTKHAFTNPQANDSDMGTVYNAKADRRSWQAMRNFLEELF
ncbi:MAG: Carboxymethylenebutenolidase [Gammaproteobacteria bacterium]|nr:Carboxymethylenebutenolidase [Gammaproteobacteria bacterium]